jgi:hypothetical protein
MAEIRTVTTLRIKRDEIAASIENYERRIAQARADLAHVTAAITIFEATGEPGAIAPYVNLDRVFKRGHAVDLCKQALASGPLNTRQLALHVMQTNGLDCGDRVLAKAIALRLVNALRMQWKRGKVVTAGKENGVRIWTLPASTVEKNR